MKADAYKIVDNVYWVGVLDWDIRDYHGYTLNGTTYNCYLVFGEDKVALIDNVYPGKSEQFWGRIKDAFEKEGREFKIDVVVQNHIENDHSGSLGEVVAKFPDVEVYCSKKAEPGLKNHLPELADFEFNTVKTGDTLDIGGKTFQFVNAPMLHWPDSMFTMLMEDGILFSNDAFGQHICVSERLDTDVDPAILTDAAKKYYANLITLSSPMVGRKIEELANLGIVEILKMIAPCHGQIFTNPEFIIDLYTKWSTGAYEGTKITIIYDTMHHSTQRMAHAMAEGVMSEGVEVKMYFMHDDDKSDAVTDVLDSKAIFVGAPTMMNNPFPGIGDVMYYFNCLSFGNIETKKAVVFGSKGWAGGSARVLAANLEGAGFEVIEQMEIDFKPTEEQLEECYELGKKVAQMIKED